MSLVYELNRDVYSALTLVTKKRIIRVSRHYTLERKTADHRILTRDDVYTMASSDVSERLSRFGAEKLHIRRGFPVNIIL